MTSANRSFFWKRRFQPLFITQFFGAFSDNAFKNAIVILITYRIAANSPHEASILVTIASGLFILPYFLFSALAGQLADKYDRAKLTRIYKAFEVVIMCTAVLAFYRQDTWFMFVVLFATSTTSTFFGPIKYSLLPQQLKPNELMMGNAYVEGSTFISILLGTIVGGVVILRTQGVFYIGVILMTSALIGYLASRFILPAPGGSADIKINKNIFSESYRLVKSVATNRRILNYLLLITWFWLIGSVFLTQMAIFVKEILHSDEIVMTTFLALFSVGIAVGSYLCTKISRGKPSLKFVPPAAFGMALFTIAMLFFSRDFSASWSVHSIISFAKQPNAVFIMLSLFGIAVSGGVYTVPLYTLMQSETANTFIARVVAVNNILNSFGMVIAVVIVLVMYMAGLNVMHVFGLVAVLNIAVGIIAGKIRREQAPLLGAKDLRI
jgi:acyl-[acyl-carrier-protein]-phospholipid O-acyltransferase/long-chain-fatty-acid--[acyl-carrier-protein] ligase